MLSTVLWRLGLATACLLSLNACDSTTAPLPPREPAVIQKPLPAPAKPIQPLDLTREQASPPAKAPTHAPTLKFRTVVPLNSVRSVTPESKPVDAPSRYERMVPRLRPGRTLRYRNLFLEANNMSMRGVRHKQRGSYRDSGRVVARRWRKNLQGARGVFVLRDSLFSQQDHPFLHAVYAPMLPPNWVTLAAHFAATGQTLQIPELPEATAHKAWQQRSKSAVFGSFPVSVSLHKRVTANINATTSTTSQEWTLNARRTIRILMRDARQMAQFAPQGAAAVAKAGADLIARSDVDYFGKNLRRNVVIPIFVEHPNTKEVGEGKGLQVDTIGVSQATVDLVMRTVYRRRLEDGDLALERYDLSKSSDRARAIAVLEALVPRADKRHTTKVWLWVNGRLDPKRKLRGEGPLAYVSRFRTAMAAANINMNRVELLAKPTVFLTGSSTNQRTKLEAQLPRYNQHSIMMSVTSTMESLARLLPR